MSVAVQPNFFDISFCISCRSNGSGGFSVRVCGLCASALSFVFAVAIGAEFCPARDFKSEMSNVKSTSAPTMGFTPALRAARLSP